MDMSKPYLGRHEEAKRKLEIRALEDKAQALAIRALTTLADPELPREKKFSRLFDESNMLVRAMVKAQDEGGNKHRLGPVIRASQIIYLWKKNERSAGGKHEA